jgi:hypothetical protein
MGEPSESVAVSPLYVADLVESSPTVSGYLDGIRREQWDEDQVLRDAVLYRMHRQKSITWRRVSSGRRYVPAEP